MNTVFKSIIIGGILGAVIGVLLNMPNFKTGDCVKELGYNSVGKVTAVSQLGGLEVTFVNPYNQDLPFIEAFTKQRQELLIKVNCN